MPRQIIAYYDGKFMSHKLWVSIIGKHERHGWRFIEFWPQVKAKLLFACRKCKYDLGRKLGIVYAYENWLLLIERIFWMNTDIKPVEIQLRKSPCSMSALFPIRKIIYFNRLSSWKIIKLRWKTKACRIFIQMLNRDFAHRILLWFSATCEKYITQTF